MRTTWIRPTSTLEPSQNNEESGKTPIPLPRTKFSNSSSTETLTQKESPQQQKGKEPKEAISGTKKVITESLSDHGKLPDVSENDVSGENPRSTPERENVRSPPPKPPRTYVYLSPANSPSRGPAVRQAPSPPQMPRDPKTLQLRNDQPERPNNKQDIPTPRQQKSEDAPDGACQNRQFPSASSNTTSAPKAPRPHVTATPVEGVEQVRSVSRRRQGRRGGPLVLPPPPSVPPPAPPQTAQARPAQPGRGSSHAWPRPRSAPQEPRREAAGNGRPAIRESGDSNVASPEEFECSCKEVFSRGKRARTYMENGQFSQAANEYQKALSVVDRVLKAQVLHIATDESTRQKFFQMQAAVFVSRKEALNGFSDAQAAVSAPPVLSMTNSTPGAPPTYDDVLREDQRRSNDQRPRIPDRPPSLSSRGTTSNGQRGRSQPSDARPVQHPPRPSQGQSARPSVRVREPRTVLPPPPSARPQPRSQQNGPAAQRPPYNRSMTHPAQEPPLRPSSRPEQQGAAQKRSMSFPESDSRLETLVDLSDLSLQPSPSLTRDSSEPRPSVQRRSRPKSCYHPSSEQEEVKTPARKSRPKSYIQQGDLSLLHIPDGGPQTQKINADTLAERNLSKGTELDNESASVSSQVIGEGTMRPFGSGLKRNQSIDRSPEAPSETTSTTATLRDPFVNVDPFASSMPSHDEDSDIFPSQFSSLSVTDHNGDTSSIISESTETPNSHKKLHRLQTPLKPLRAPSEKEVQHLEETNTEGFTKNGMDSISREDVGESLLEALDFATCQTPGHPKVSPQRSRGSIKASRCRSEDTLLDCSYNTLGKYLEAPDMCASRVSIIDEFDPLSTHVDESSYSLPKLQDSTSDENNTDGMPQGFEDEEEPYYAEPRKLLREIEEAAPERSEVNEKNFHTMDFESQAPTSYSSGRSSYSPASTFRNAYDENRRKSSACSASESSWPSSPLSSPPGAHFAGEPWAPWQPEPLTTDVGRSKFYPPPANRQQESPVEPSPGASSGPCPPSPAPGPSHSAPGSFRKDSRELLRIRDGVKIFFIYDDDVVTSPWNRPYLSIVKDTEKAWYTGEGLTVYVGDSLWSAALNKKSTLVLRAESGVYLFQDTAQKPECRAVGVRVPLTTRRAQQDLFARLLQENSRLEDERPSGITKTISKSASAAATKMEKIAISQTVPVSNPPFVRRNSIRALKGVSKRLQALAERTGYCPEELPDDYSNLEAAANVLRYARNAKTIQYI